MINASDGSFHSTNPYYGALFGYLPDISWIICIRWYMNAYNEWMYVSGDGIMMTIVWIFRYFVCKIWF